MRFISNKDTILLNYNRLIADCGQELFLHPLREIRRILIMTTAQRVFNQTVFLVFETRQEFYVIGILHPDFQYILQMTERVFDIDENAVIAAMQNVGQKDFVLYQKG